MKRRSIVSSVSIMITAVLVIGVSLAFITVGWIGSKQFRDTYQQRLEVETTLLGQSLAGPLWSYNYDAARTIGRAFAAHSEISQVRITAAETDETIFQLEKADSSADLLASQDILYEDEVIGHVEVGMSSALMKERLRQSFYFTLILMLAIAAIIFVAVRLFLTRLLENPIRQLANWSQEIAQGKYQAASEGTMAIRELAPVGEQINLMAGKIETRENSLKRIIELESTLSRIQQECVALRRWNQAHREFLQAAMQHTAAAMGMVCEQANNPDEKKSLKLRAMIDFPFGGKDKNRLFSFCSPALDCAEPVLANSPEQMPEHIRAVAIEAGIHSFIAIPLRRHRGVIGVLVLANLSRAFQQSDIDNLEPLVRSISNVIVAARDDAALRRSEDENQAILEGALTGIVTTLIDGTIVNLNPFAANIFGTTREQLINLNAVDTLVAESQKDAARQMFTTLTTRGDSSMLGTPYKMTGRRMDGTEFPAELILTLHQDKQHVTGVLRDLSEQVAAEQALARAQKMEAIGQLTGGIAHDFTNILGIIIGNLEFLMNPSMPGANAREQLKSAHRAAMRATDLTRQLLNFARTKPALVETTDINAVIKGMNQLLGRSVTQLVDLQYQMQDDLWETDINPGELEDALLNLAINARDAMPTGGSLRIATGNTAVTQRLPGPTSDLAPGEYVTIAVKDTGTGIPAENLERIFEPFFSTKAQGQGTGLGLAMVFAFAKRSGGAVKVESKVGLGTEFTIYLPRSMGSKASRASAAGPGDALPPGKESILVVDDEFDLVKLATANLKAMGYQVLTAHSAEEALELLETHPEINLLFTDTVMPGKYNGRDLAEMALQRRPALKVLMTSGYNRAINLMDDVPGGQSLLAKPYSRSELIQRIRMALDAD